MTDQNIEKMDREERYISSDITQFGGVNCRAGAIIRNGPAKHDDIKKSAMDYNDLRYASRKLSELRSEIISHSKLSSSDKLRLNDDIRRGFAIVGEALAMLPGVKE